MSTGVLSLLVSIRHVGLFLFLWLVSAAPLSAATIALTRLGVCPPLAVCSLTINDNDLNDLDPAEGIVSFDETIGALQDGIFDASGTLTETIVRDAAGRVVGISLLLTNTVVGGVSGGIGAPANILGQLAFISGVPFTSLHGAAGWAALSGAYDTFPAGGAIGSADLILEARLGGALLGRVDPAAVNNALGPVPFAGIDFGVLPFPVSNLLVGTINFGVGGNEGFLLPASGEATAQEIPEPAAIVLLGSALLAVQLWRIRRDVI